MALAACGERPDSEILSSAADGLMEMQEESGAFSTFGDGTLRPNWCWLSNTARSLQALVTSGRSLDDAPVRRALSWILGQQNADGSWIDGWCSRYIYGTAIALETLFECGALSGKDQAATRAVAWLLQEQNPDGGWGEDWRGTRARSSAEHTGLAVYALSRAIAAGGACPVQSIEAGINWLIQNQRDDGSWAPCYFVNSGFGTGFADSHLPIVWALHGLAEGRRALEGRYSQAHAGGPAKWKRNN
jgi:squalene-hopene/tetraprenyl-beta-curcumene cyclase